MSGEFYTPPLLTPGTVSPGGGHTTGHRTNTRRFSTIVAEGLTWVRKRLPGPGAMNYAFDTLALAESTPIGPGIRQRQFWATTQAPLFLEGMSRPTSGLGGIIQGNMYSQPLFDPYANQYGNIHGSNQ